MKIDKKIQIVSKYYTIDCVCKLYDFLKHEHLRYPVKPEVYKATKSIYNLLDKIIVKLKKALLTKGENDELKFNLEYYQAFNLGLFLLENHEEYKGLAERTILLNLSREIDGKL